ncbi:MAG: 2-polyprenylphenol 6-hydroxylase [Magnetococcales bacterium]|nr:2-polyprenylphenol 6-hydroxylase [Magnetococcales bacterium]
MLSTYRNLLRLAEILGILVRHRIPALVDRFFMFRLMAWVIGLRPSIRRHWREHDEAARLRMALEELGPTFVKFGQMLSTRMDALPENIGKEMKKLQDSVPPFPIEEVRAAIQSSLGGPVESFYAEFNETPVASASIAQVHKALSLDGRVVAVKVMRPNAASVVEKDISILLSLARIVNEYVPEWKRFKVSSVVDEFAETIRKEMDFQVEAAHAQQLHKNFEDDATLWVPEVMWPQTGRQILTLEWIDGTPVSEYLRDKSNGPDPALVARNLITMFFHQVFRDGYFHADLHPGNIFVQPDGGIAIVDFGIVGQVTLQTRLWLAEMMKGFLLRDYRKVAQIHLDAGYVPSDTDMEAFEEACRQVGEPVFGRPLKEISIARLLAQMFKVTARFQMEVQPQLLLLQKTMFTLEGVGREINPELNMWLLTEPLVREWMKEYMGPKGKLKSLNRDIQDLTHAVGYLPRLLHTGLERLVHDRMQMRLHPDFLENLERNIQSGFHRQSLSIAGSAFFIAAAILIAADASPFWYVPALFFGTINMIKGFLMVRSN